MHCLTLTRDRTILIAWPPAAAIALAFCCNFPGRAFADPRTSSVIVCQNFVRVLNDLPIDWPSSSLPMAWIEADQSVFILTKGHDQWRGLVRFDFVDSTYEFISTKFIHAPGSIVCSRDGSTVLCWNQREIVIWRANVAGLWRAVGSYSAQCGLSPDGQFAYFSGTIEAGLAPVPYGIYAFRLDGSSPKLTRLDDPIEAGARRALPSLLGVSSHTNRIYYSAESRLPRLYGRELVIAELTDGSLSRSVSLPYELAQRASIGNATLDTDTYMTLWGSNARWVYVDEDRSLAEGRAVSLKEEPLRGFANWRAEQFVNLDDAHTLPTECVDFHLVGSTGLAWVKYQMTDHLPIGFYDVIWTHGSKPRIRVPRIRGYSKMFVSRNAVYSVLLSDDRDGLSARCIPLTTILDGIAEAALSPKGVFQLAPIK